MPYKHIAINNGYYGITSIQECISIIVIMGFIHQLTLLEAAYSGEIM